MESLNETFNGGESWFDPYPGEGFADAFENKCAQGRPKIDKNGQISLSVETMTQVRQKEPQSCLPHADHRFRHNK